VKHSLQTGVSFGLTSAVITTLGLMAGLHSGTHSKIVVLGGILTIAIADAFSDALGIHVSEEFENVHTVTQIWTSTIATFVAKLLFALTFAVPVLLLPLGWAVVVSMAWGLSILAVMSVVMAKVQKGSPWKIAGEHLLIAVVVIAATHKVGEWIAVING